jgi:hypothetical protein
LLGILDGLFNCKSSCCKSSCCCEPSCCGTCGGGGTEAASPAEAPAEEAAPLPEAPKADPTASLRRSNRVRQASRSVVIK